MDGLVELVELPVHLQNGDLVAIVSVWPVEELDARVRARELTAARDPRDGGALVEEVHRLEERLALLHHHAHKQHVPLVVVRDELRRQHLDHRVRVLLLRICTFTFQLRCIPSSIV